MIIFLDIDGVLNGGKNGFDTVDEYAKARKQFKEDFGITFLLPDVNVLPFVECINKYIEQNGENSIKAVLSSTWRYGSENIGLLNNMLYKKGLKDIEFITDKTDRINDCRTAKDRGNQINRWARKNKPKGFVILDDEFSTMIHKGRLYKTNTFVGFRNDDIDIFLNHINKWRDNENKGN